MRRFWLLLIACLIDGLAIYGLAAYNVTLEDRLLILLCFKGSALLIGFAFVSKPKPAIRISKIIITEHKVPDNITVVYGNSPVTKHPLFRVNPKERL